jgi:Family of unknown function (DUF6152)
MQKTKRNRAAWAAMIAMLALPAALTAHHSLANFDTSAPIWVRGRVVAFERVNPHSVIFVDEPGEDGQVRRWAVDAPAAAQLARVGLEEVVEPGDVVEICGFTTTRGAESQRAFPEPLSLSLRSSTTRPSGQIMNGHLLVMPDGEKKVLSDYGQLYRCLGPEDQDLLRR